MKITKRQLRRIIKEEKAKLLSETMTGTDMALTDNTEKALFKFVNAVEADLKAMYDRNVSKIADRYNQDAWEEQVERAVGDLYSKITDAAVEVEDKVMIGGYTIGARRKEGI
jgi:hypothetical protein